MALTEAEAQAAASVTAAFLDVPVEQAVVVEAPQEAVSSTEVEDDTAEVEEAAAPSFSFDTTIPEDILREIEEAEIDDEVEREIQARQEVDEYGEETFGETEDEIRKRISLEKRNAYLEAELAKTRSSSWKAEAEKYFPLAKYALDDIKATSRRSFLKQAKARHDQILPHVQEALVGAKAAAEAAKVAARNEGKEAARVAFGEPLTGPDVQTIDRAAAQAELADVRESARRTRDLSGLFRAMIEKGF